MSRIVSALFDPTVLFTLGCLSVAPCLAYLDRSERAVPEIIAYLRDPALLAGFVVLLMTLFLSGNWPTTMSNSDGRIALWYLMNGAFIHITMDGLTGGWHYLHLLNVHYGRLDRRFLEDESVSWMITQIELFVMAPLCLLTYRAIVKHSNLRHPLEIITSLCQLWGAVIFFGSEVLNNFPNVPIDRQMLFDFHHCLYFWFGFGANLIWIVIPLWLAISSLSILSKIIPTAKPKSKQV